MIPASTDLVFDRSIGAIRGAIDRMATSVSPPVIVYSKRGPHYRYREADYRQALVLKSVRYFSALLALRTLVDEGLGLDAGAMMRVMDEIDADILFIAGPVIFQKQPEDNHRRFLSEFFQEEFDNQDPLKSSQRRDRVPRKKIRAYVARTYSAGDDTSGAINILETIETAFSGYVHGAAVHTMDVYDGRVFCVPMEPGDKPLKAVQQQSHNYCFRGLCAVAIAAKALRCEELFKSLNECSKELFALQ